MSALPALRITAQDVRRLIAERHGLGAAQQPTPNASEWALFFELRNGTGYSGSAGERYVDAFAFNLYPSKKHWRVSYEIKVSRGDFLHELNSPQKRQWAFEISNEFWFACAPGVAKPEELPEGCGLLVVSGSKLKRVVAAKQRATARDLGMAEMAAIARKALDAGSLRDAKWRHAGCDLTESALDELVATRWDAQREDFHRKQAEAGTAAKLAEVAKAMLLARDAMAEAGIPPFPWMADLDRIAHDPHCRLARNTSWDTRDWVRANVSPGPNAQGLSTAISEHARATRELERMQTAMQKTMAALTAQLAAVGTALAESVDIAGNPP